MKVIVNFTPTGMIPTKDMTPHVPVSVSEIVEDVHRAVEIGITMAHIHAREEDTGSPTFDPNTYGRIIEGIRSFAPELVICVSLSGRDFGEFEKRAAPLTLDGDLKPDMGSLTLSSLNFNKQASVNEPDMIQRLAAEMKRRQIVPELEIFDTGMVNYARYLLRKDLIDEPCYANIIVGNIASAQANLLHVGVIVRDLPERWLWSMGGVGDAQLPMNGVALAAGGGVRVGLEDNIWFDRDRRTLATNESLLKRIHEMAAACDREIMSAAELRRRLNLADRSGTYGRSTLAAHSQVT